MVKMGEIGRRFFIRHLAMPRGLHAGLCHTFLVVLVIILKLRLQIHAYTLIVLCSLPNNV